MMNRRLRRWSVQRDDAAVLCDWLLQKKCVPGSGSGSGFMYGFLAPRLTKTRALLCWTPLTRLDTDKIGDP
jgi:hypothetical protein